jgi:hypothetical protein
LNTVETSRIELASFEALERMVNVASTVDTGLDVADVAVGMQSRCVGFRSGTDERFHIAVVVVIVDLLT